MPVEQENLYQEADQENQKTPEALDGESNEFSPRKGDVVKVERSDGAIDDGWTVTGHNNENGAAIVSKQLENGKIGVKHVPKFELYKLNGESGQDLFMSGTEWFNMANKALKPFGLTVDSLKYPEKHNSRNEFSLNDIKEQLKKARIINISGIESQQLSAGFWEKELSLKGAENKKQNSQPDYKKEEIINPELKIPKFNPRTGERYSPEERLRLAQRKEKEILDQREIAAIRSQLNTPQKEQRLANGEWSAKDALNFKMFCKDSSLIDKQPELGLIFIDLIKKAIATHPENYIYKSMLQTTQELYGTNQFRLKCNVSKYEELKREYAV